MKNLFYISTMTLALSTSLFGGGGGDILRSSLNVTQAEYQLSDTESATWDLYGFIGYDANKIYIYSDGDKEKNAGSESQNELLFSHAIAPYWDVQAGLTYDKSGVNSNTWAEVALSGLAPYFFETRVALLVDKNSNVALRTDFEYEALLSQKLIFTPSLQVDIYTKDDLKMGIGSGLSNITAGARLRYEFKREFAPYIGCEYNRNFGTTNKLSTRNEIYGVVGLKMWF